MTDRVVVYTGKGGVGKTSVAAATALLCAERGHRTLVLSTDIAHSLGDAFGERLGAEPRAIADGLWAEETDVYHTIRLHWGAIQRYFTKLFSWGGLDDIAAEEMSVLPGFDELASLLRIVDHHGSGNYDTIIVDAAPTGETVRLLSLPDAASWWLDRILPIQRRAAKLAGPMLRRMTGMPMPGDDVFRAGEDLFRRLQRLRALLADPEHVSMRVVLNPEPVVLAEARRSFTYLHLFGYSVDLVVCNRVLPDSVGGPFAALGARQRKLLPSIEEAFAPVPMRQSPYFSDELVGQAPLRALGVAIFGDADPSCVFHRGRPYRIEREDGGFALSLDLPLASRDEVELIRVRDELVVQVGPWRRSLVLPRALAEAPTEDAEFKDGVLRIHFPSVRERST